MEEVEEVDEAMGEAQEQEMVALPRGSYFWTLELFPLFFLLPPPPPPPPPPPSPPPPPPTATLLRLGRH